MAKTKIGAGLTLSTLLDGNLEELFQESLTTCVDDMVDLNKPANKPRKVLVEISFAPGMSRSDFGIRATCKSVLPSREAIEGFGQLGQTNMGATLAVGQETRQVDIESAIEHAAARELQSESPDLSNFNTVGDAVDIVPSSTKEGNNA